MREAWRSRARRAQAAECRRSLKTRPPSHDRMVITVQDWTEIRYLHGSEGMSVRAISARLGLSRDTVSRAVKSSSPPRYARVSGPSAFDPFEGHVRQLLAEFPAMSATVLAERAGWQGSASWFRKKVGALRVEYAPKEPADRWQPAFTRHPGAGHGGASHGHG
jgi:hypothetical protein